MTAAQNPTPPLQQRYYDEDEISLIDLWLVLMRRKWFIAGVFGVAVVVGLAMALMATHRYSYTTTVEIGTRILKEQVSTIEPPDTVLAKLTEGYIPLALQQYAGDNPDELSRYRIRASIPKGSQLVVLSSEGPMDEEATYVALHNAIIHHLREDHRRIIDVMRKGLELQLSSQNNKLAEIEDQAELLEARLKRVEQTRELVLKEAESTRALIADATARQTRAVGEATDEARAMTLLMISNEIQRNRTRLAELEERAQIRLVHERDSIAKDLADNRRQRAQQAAQVENIELQLANIQETRALAPPMRSLNPTGPNKKLMLALAAVLGLMLGIFGAFFMEFLAKAREQAAGEAQG